MASVEKLPSGRYRPIARDADGRKIPGLGTFERWKDAKAKADKAEVEARQQAAAEKGDIPATITWSEWWKILEPRRQFDSDTGADQKKVVAKYLEPKWGDVPLNKIKRREVQAWIDDDLRQRRTPADKPLSAGYVNKIYRLFATTINAAVKADPPVLTVSPLAGIDLPKIVRKRKPHIAVDQVAPLAKVLRADYADATEFVMETGLRPGELAGLHDEQIDLDAKLLVVSNTYVSKRKMIRGYPKDKDMRTVALSARAVEIYRRRVADRDMSKPCGEPHFHDEMCVSDLVFRTTRGAVLQPAYWRQAMAHAASKPGVVRAVPYGGRRGFATRLARSGKLDLFELMDVMGWADPKLAREYVQESTGARERLMAALEDPSAATLRVVEGEKKRGTARGTDPSRDPSESSGKRRRRNVS